MTSSTRSRQSRSLRRPGPRAGDGSCSPPQPRGLVLILSCRSGVETRCGSKRHGKSAGSSRAGLLLTWSCLGITRPALRSGTGKPSREHRPSSRSRRRHHVGADVPLPRIGKRWRTRIATCEAGIPPPPSVDISCSEVICASKTTGAFRSRTSTFTRSSRISLASTTLRVLPGSSRSLLHRHSAAVLDGTGIVPSHLSLHVGHPWT